MPTYFQIVLLACYTLSLNAMNSSSSEEIDIFGDQSSESVVRHDSVPDLLQFDFPQPAKRELSPYEILYNAIQSNNEMGVAIALVNYEQLNARGLVAGIDDPPLCVAASMGRRAIIKILLDNGAHFTTTDGDGNQAVHCAARNHHLQALQLLHAHGASLEARNLKGQTVLLIALEQPPLSLSLIQWLMKKNVNVNAQDENDNSVAHYAYAHDREDIWDELDRVDEMNWKLLNNKGLLPNKVALLPYYQRAPTPPPPPILPEKTVAFDTLDELLGVFYTERDQLIESEETHAPQDIQQRAAAPAPSIEDAQADANKQESRSGFFSNLFANYSDSAEESWDE